MAFHRSQRAGSSSDNPELLCGRFSFGYAFRFYKGQFHAFESLWENGTAWRPKTAAVISALPGQGTCRCASDVLAEKGREKNDKKMQDSAGRGLGRSGAYAVWLKDRAGGGGE